MKVLLDQMLRHMMWADRLSAVSIKSNVQRDAVTLFAHIAAAEDLYLKRILGEDPFPQDFWPPLTLDDAAILAGESIQAMRKFVAERSDGELTMRVRYRNSKGTYFETPVSELITHLALHGEHHRGQIARILRGCGGSPAVTDFIAFVREEEVGS